MGISGGMKLMGRFVLIGLLVAARPLLRLRKWPVIWVVNAGSESDKKAYGPLAKLNERRGWEVVPVGLFRVPGVGWNLIVGTSASNDDLRAGAQTCERTVGAARRFRADRIALNGVLPSCLTQHGIWPDDDRMVKGQYATVHMISNNVEDVLAERPDLGGKAMAVVGVGATGRLVANELARPGYNVVAFDVRPEAADGLDPRVQFCGMDTAALADVGVVVLLSTGGDQGAASIERDIAPGSVIVSDTHPKLSRSSVASLRSRGVTVYESALTKPGTRFVPKLPKWAADTIPGCVGQAIVEQKLGRPAIEQDGFDIAASRILGSRLDRPEGAASPAPTRTPA